MSRKAWPELRSHSLGNLIKHFNISVNDRHRALDDAVATAKLLGKMLNSSNGLNSMKQFVNEGVMKSKLPDGLSIETIRDLPESHGVYYLKDSEDEVLYIGKAKNIKKRIKQHFQKTGRKSEKFQNLIDSIDYVLTGNELISLLLEDSEIKKYRPRINKAQKNRYRIQRVLVHQTKEELHRLELMVPSKADSAGLKVLNSFSSKKSAESYLYQLSELFELCPCHLNIIRKNGAQCMEQLTGKCNGNPIFSEEAETYNEKVRKAAEHAHTYFDNDFYIVDYGRTLQEKSIIKVKDGKCNGIGYFEGKINRVDEFDMHLTEYKGDKNTNRMIFQYINSNISHKIIPID